MKFATWNVNSLNVRLPQVLDWLSQTRTDILALQELKIPDERFPHETFTQAGYYSECFGQKTYNGVALISRFPMTNILHNIPDFEDNQSRLIAATIEGIRIVGAYFPNGESPESDKYKYKMCWLNALHTWLGTELKNHPKLILAGDYNIAPDDRDVHDPIAWKDKILCTPQERAHFQNLLDLGLYDTFRLFEQEPGIWSWWDYRNFSFQKNKGLRIDLILASNELKEKVMSSFIDKLPRKNERPSDHAPAVIEIGL